MARRRSPLRAAHAAVLALVWAPAAVARPPAIVPWQEAGRHVGAVVSVEGMVAASHVAGGTCTLEFAPGDPQALRVVLVLGLLSTPPDVERRWTGRRIRASGRIQRFQGRPEMILRRADQIEVLDPEPVAVPSPTAPPAVAPPGTTPPPPAATPTDCETARARRTTTARALATRADVLARCIGGGDSRCAAERDAVSAALAALAAREGDEAAACP